MAYKLTIEMDSLEALYETVSNLRGKATVTMQSEAPEAEPVKKTRKPRTAAGASVADEPAGSDTAEPEVTYDEVKKVTLNLIAKKGKPETLALLDQFGAASAVELKPGQYAEFVATANALASRL